MFIFGIILVICLKLSSGYLKINVRNQGGELIEETLSGNITEDFTTLEFIKPDGTIIAHVIDFQNDVQIFQVLVLGEEERGQSQYQVMCFITSLDKGDYIASDAIAKLRQKNPHAERQAEEQLADVSYQMDVAVHLNRSAAISPHIGRLCAEAAGATYSRQQDIRQIAARAAGDLDSDALAWLEGAVSPLAAAEARCSGQSALHEPCRCRYHLCLSWYPCRLKFCRGQDADGQTISYRCGIRTCRRCHRIDYRVHRKQLCLWDEESRAGGDVSLMQAADEDAF